MTDLLIIGNFVWVYSLLFSFLLIFFRGRLRNLFASVFVFSHLAFAVSVKIGSYPYGALAGVILFIRGDFWNTVDSLAQRLADTSQIKLLLTVLGKIDSQMPSVSFSGSFVDTKKFDLIKMAIYYVILVAAGFHLIFANLNTVGIVNLTQNPVHKNIEAAGFAFGVEQPSWGIFAPNPSDSDEYWIIAVETRNGTRLDINFDRPRPLTYDRPGKHLNKQWNTYRYRFFYGDIPAVPEVASSYFDYICWHWSFNGMRAHHINMYEREERVTLETLNSPDQRNTTVNRVFSHACDPGETPINVTPSYN